MVGFTELHGQNTKRQKTKINRTIIQAWNLKKKDDRRHHAGSLKIHNREVAENGRERSTACYRNGNPAEDLQTERKENNARKGAATGHVADTQALD